MADNNDKKNQPWKNQPISEFKDSVEFLEQLRPGGPWVLTAIIPDGAVTTVTANTTQEARTFLNTHNNKRNLYFALNPVRRHMTSKASKVDVSFIEFIHADLDPRPNETPAQGKDRYFNALASFSPPSTALIDSGNGVQVLWRLNRPIELGELVDGKLSEADTTLIADVEGRIALALETLGGTLGTQNIDRILRIPGTINLPNKKKLTEGRVPCPAKLIWFNSNTHELDDFPALAVPLHQDEKTGEQTTKVPPQVMFNSLSADLKKLVAGKAYPGEDRSQTVASVIYNLRRRRFTDQQIVELIKAFPEGIGERYVSNIKKLEDDVRRIERKYINGNLQPPVLPKSSLVISAQDVKPRSQDWIWPGHLLRGAQELLTGVPGLGKSQVQISFIACATTGSAWPDGAPGVAPMNVIMLTAEDSIDQAVVPRLIAAGANLTRVKILKLIKSEGKNRQFLLSEDLDELEKAVSEIGDVGLVTVDPITAYMGSKMDSHKATEVRSQLGPLKDFAEQTGIAVSSVTHPPKSGGQRAIDQYIGSQAFIAAGRIGHICVEEYEFSEDGEKEPTGRVLFANPKNNAHVKMSTLVFHIEQTFVANDHVTGNIINSPKVIWDGEKVGVSADDAVAVQNSQQPRKKKENAQGNLQTMLVSILGEGPVEVSQIQQTVYTAGYTKDQLRTAKEALQLVSTKTGEKWTWELISQKLTSQSS